MRLYRFGFRWCDRPLFSNRLIVLSLIVMAGLSGCVYLRLLEFKQQLAKFDEFFRVEVTDRFTLHFKKPMLFGKDFVYLSKLQPTDIRSISGGQRWLYVFHKTASDGTIAEPAVDAVFQMDFNSGDQLVSFTLSEIFLAMVPPQFLELSFRSLGTAEVDRKKRQVRANSTLIEKIKIDPPKRDAIVKVLGPPTEIQPQEDGLELYLYSFLLETEGHDPKYDSRRKAVTKLYFDPETDYLIKVWGKFTGLKISIDYRHLVEENTLGSSEVPAAN